MYAELAPVLIGETLAAPAARHSHLDSAQGRQHTHHRGDSTHTTTPGRDIHNTHETDFRTSRGREMLLGTSLEDHPRDDLGGGLEELVLALALEEGVGAIHLRVGGVEHLCCPVAHL